MSGGVVSSLFDGLLGAPFALVESIIRRVIVAAVEILQAILPRWVVDKIIPMPILGMLDQGQTSFRGTGVS